MVRAMKITEAMVEEIIFTVLVVMALGCFIYALYMSGVIAWIFEI